MKIIALISLFLCLSACQPTAVPLQQRHHFVCKSLIEGYLKTQHLAQFELWKKQYIKMQLTHYMIYIYREPTVSGLVLGIPKPNEMEFQCYQNTSQQYVVTRTEPTGASTVLLKVLMSPKQLTDTFQASLPEIR